MAGTATLFPNCLYAEASATAITKLSGKPCRRAHSRGVIRRIPSRLISPLILVTGVVSVFAEDANHNDYKWVDIWGTKEHIAVLIWFFSFLLFPHALLSYVILL